MKHQVYLAAAALACALSAAPAAAQIVPPATISVSGEAHISVPPDLADEIRRLFAGQGPQADGYGIRIAEIFPGERKPHPWGYTLAPVRLYRRDRGRYVDSTVHDRVHFERKPQLARLKGIIHHFSVRSLGDQIASMTNPTAAPAIAPPKWLA